jgi:YVTN family beta-propeller protein
MKLDKRLFYSVIFLAIGVGISWTALAENRLLVVHKWADSLGLYEAASGKSLATIPIGKDPHELAVDLTKEKAYVTEYGVRSYTEESKGGNTIAIVDLDSMKRTGEINLGRFHRPHGIHQGASGLLYVTVDFPAAMLVIDPETRTIVQEFELDQSLPHMVAVFADESRAFAANSGSGTVSVIDLETRSVVDAITIGGVPMGFALTADNKTLFASNRTGNGVAVVDTSRNRVVRTIEIHGQPARLHLMRNDTMLLVSLHEAGDVAVVNTETFEVIERFHAGANVEGMNVDEAAGLGYVSAQGDDQIIEFSLESWEVLKRIRAGSRPDPIQILP